MDLISYIILGIVQGLSEFLPISSSGHLVLAKKWLGVSDGGATFEVMVHFGTLISVVFYFKDDIVSLLRDGTKHATKFIKFAFIGLKKDIDRDDLYAPYYLWFILISMIPAGYVGIVYKDDIEHLFSNLTVTLTCLAITGLIMLISPLAKERKKSFGSIGAFIIGTVQAIAILPGISRSGSTIVAGMFLGYKREFIAKFSFLMSLPVIFGAFLLKLRDLFQTDVTIDQWMAYGLGTIAAAISGYFAIVLVMKLVQKGKFFYFGIYCLIISGLGFLYL